MSRRRIEQGVNAGSSFSLRTMSTEQAGGGLAGFAVASRKPASSPPAVPTHSGLTFKFNTPALGNAGLSPTMAAKPTLPPAIPMQLSNPFGTTSPGHQKSQDVMRLSVATDELRQRLKTSTDKCSQLETALHRTQQQLARERSDAQQQVHAVRSEVASVRESELKLRSELASRPTVSEFKQDKFQSAVRTAMEAEEMTARVADSEARVITLTKRAESLNAEVLLLEKARAEAIEVTAANSKAMFTEEQIAEKLTALASAETKIADAENRLSALVDDVERHDALRDAHKADTTKAELEMVAANEALVSAVGDLTATRQEHGEVSLKVSELKETLIDVQTGIDAANSKAFDAMTAPDEHVATPARASITVTGAMPPDTILGFPYDSNTRRIEEMGCSGCGLPYHLGMDAPITIGAAAQPEGSTPVDDMIKAVVADLKGYLAFAVEENAKRGIAHGAATGAGAAPAAIEVM